MSQEHRLVAEIAKPASVSSGKKLVEMGKQLMQRKFFQFETNEEFIFHYHNTPQAILQPEIHQLEMCIIFTNKRIVKLEKAKIVASFRFPDIAQVKFVRVGLWRYDKILVTDRRGHQDTVGIWDETICKFFYECLNRIVAHYNKTMKLPSDWDIPLQQHQGYLLKIGGTGIVKSWIKRYFMTKNGELLFWHDDSAPLEQSAERRIPLKGVIIDPHPPMDKHRTELKPDQLKLAFSINPPPGVDKYRVLIPSQEKDRKSWFGALTRAGAIMKGGDATLAPAAPLLHDDEGIGAILHYIKDEKETKGYFLLLPESGVLKVWPKMEEQSKSPLLAIPLIDAKAQWVVPGTNQVDETHSFELNYIFEDRKESVTIFASSRRQCDHWIESIQRATKKARELKIAIPTSKSSLSASSQQISTPTRDRSVTSPVSPSSSSSFATPISRTHSVSVTSAPPVSRPASVSAAPPSVETKLFTLLGSQEKYAEFCTWSSELISEKMTVEDYHATVFMNLPLSDGERYALIDEIISIIPSWSTVIKARLIEYQAEQKRNFETRAAESTETKTEVKEEPRPSISIAAWQEKGGEDIITLLNTLKEVAPGKATIPDYALTPTTPFATVQRAHEQATLLLRKQQEEEPELRDACALLAHTLSVAFQKLNQQQLPLADFPTVSI